MKRAILSLSLFLVSIGTFLTGPVLFREHSDFTAHAAINGNAGLSGTSIGESACKSVPNNTDCVRCFDSGGVWTAVGCLGQSSNDEPGGKLNDFIRSFLELGIGLGGGVAFLLILFSGFQRITSAGNPEKLHEAKELMTAAISGLLLIILSIFLLRLIGVNILQIPGFS